MYSMAGLRTLQDRSYWPDFPGEPSVIVGVRTCLPLRGSSGFSPDSLFHPRLAAGEPWNRFDYIPTFWRAAYYILWISCRSTDLESAESAPERIEPAGPD